MASNRPSRGDGVDPDRWAASLSAVAGQSRPAAEAGPRPVLVVGGGRVGRRLSTRLAAARPVHHLDTDPTVVAGPTPHEATHVPDLAAPATLGMAAEGGELAVVLTGEDGRNLLVTQQLRLRIGLERVIVVLADPRNRDVFDLPGVETICAGATLVDAVASSLDTDPVVPS